MKKLKTLSQLGFIAGVAAACVLLAGHAAAIDAPYPGDSPGAVLCLILLVVAISVAINFGLGRLLGWGVFAATVGVSAFFIGTILPGVPFLLIFVPVLIGAGTFKKIAVPVGTGIRSICRHSRQAHRASFGAAPVCVPARHRLSGNQPCSQRRVGRQSPVKGRHDDQ
jgi:hypothetical protein